MDAIAVLEDLFGRIPPLAEHALDGLTPADLVRRPAPGANPVAWLVWHVGRVQDAQIADLDGAQQVWVTGPWAERMGRTADPGDTGYGHSASDVDSVRTDDPHVLLDYVQAVHARVLTYLGSLSPADLDRVVDTRWDPPVTAGVRLVSIAGDCLEHVGQAAYVRGLLQG